MDNEVKNDEHFYMNAKYNLELDEKENGQIVLTDAAAIGNETSGSPGGVGDRTSNTNHYVNGIYDMN